MMLVPVNLSQGVMYGSPIFFVHLAPPARSLTHFVVAGNSPPKIQNFTLRDKLSAVIFGVSIPPPRNTCTPAKYGFPYDTCTIVSKDGTRLEAWHISADHSRGLVLLFHGYIAPKCSLLNEAKIYHDLGYDSLLVDFRGSGGSQGNDTTIGYAEADDVAAYVHCPTLLMNATDDPFVRPSEAKTIFAQLAGPKRDVWFDHVGHDAFLPKYPQAWRDAVTSFLNDMFH